MVPIVTNIVPYRFSSVVIKDSSRARKPIAASWFNGCPTRVPKPLSLIMFECRLTLEPQLVQKTKIYISVNYGKSFTYSYLMCWVRHLRILPYESKCYSSVGSATLASAKHIFWTWRAMLSINCAYRFIPPLHLIQHLVSQNEWCGVWVAAHI